MFSNPLSSSLGGKYACPDEDAVTYTCTKTTQQVLRWLVPPYVVMGDNLFFFNHDKVMMTRAKNNFTATLIDIKNSTSNPTLFEITMTLNFPISQVENGTAITCVNNSGNVMDTQHLYTASMFIKNA